MAYVRTVKTASRMGYLWDALGHAYQLCFGLPADKGTGYGDEIDLQICWDPVRNQLPSPHPISEADTRHPNP
ncbi:MAG TPA: hypothetical protein VHC49_25885 [Mycobacteriales bacterium]|nr:hypothetical protein [Mycobacteriales bacterium]